MKSGFFILSLITLISPFSSLALTPIPGANFRVNVIEARKYTSSDLAKLARAVHAIETVMNSQELKDKIINFTYNGKREFVQNEGMTNEQIYNYLMAGGEIHPKVRPQDGMMDVELQLYKPKLFQSKRVIGYTDPSYFTIYVNQNYFRPAAISDIADNMVHEWCHKMGFDHDFKSTARRPYSVPYAVGYIVDDLVATLNP